MCADRALTSRFSMDCRGFVTLFIIIYYTSVINMALAYNCYETTDKASKPLDLSSHSSSISHTVERSKRDTSKKASGALEFDTGNYLYVTDIDSQAKEHDEFSISFWLYLEGGQSAGATILSLKNTCFLYSPWSFRLYPASDDNGMKSQLTFTIEDVYRQKKSVAMNEYQHHSWFQLTVVNSIKQLRMYVNGVRLTTGEGMKWKEFADTECLRLELGRQKTKSFRGKLSKLMISHQALTSRQVKQINADIPISSAGLWFDDALSAFKSNWTSDSPPTAVEELINQKTAQTIVAPACGKTVCDDPSMVKAYATNPALKRKKLGGTDMIDSLPNIHTRALSVAPTYDRQFRATPGPRSQSQTWDEEENYVVDNSAGMPSRNFFRKSYSLPLTRSGRSGGQWRHIKQATGQTGSNILFIEGTVKDHDVKNFPPFGILQPQVKYNRYGQRLLPGRTGSGYRSNTSQFSSRAKAGFQYWYKEPKSNISQPPPQPFRTISGHQLTTRGVGYHR